MPSIDENRQRWNSYDWSETGDEWSFVWGGTENLWWGSIYPRIRHLLPVPVILEIAPGMGRFTQYLKSYCDEIHLIDLSERAIEGCKERFRDDNHLIYHLGDGQSLSSISDRCVDFVFSFDSLVHCEQEVVDAYLQDLPSRMTSQATGFLHHSNFAALIDPVTGEAACDNENWRSISGSAEQFARTCREAGLICVSQELVNWGLTRELTDCLSVISMPESPVVDADAGRRRFNPDFIEEALALRRMTMFAFPDLVDLTIESRRTRAETNRLEGLEPPLELHSFATYPDYRAWRHQRRGELTGRRRREIDKATADRPFRVPGRCFVCDQPTRFEVSWDYAFEMDGVLTPNWREQLFCPRCGLNGRMRATIHLLETRLGGELASSCYITEQASPLYNALAKRHPHIIGSDFLRDGTSPGATNVDGLRHEDLTRLSFADESFSLIVSLDVLEHVPAYGQALEEACRVLKPDGSFFYTAPFLPDSPANLVRARLQTDGSIEHFEPPEYHFDPLDQRGVLAFYQFGWELLEATKLAGFREAYANFFYSFDYGYWGPFHVYFHAIKS